MFSRNQIGTIAGKVELLEKENRRLDVENANLKENVERGRKIDESEVVMKKEEVLRLEGLLNAKKKE